MIFNKSTLTSQVAKNPLLEYLEAAQCPQFLQELQKIISITATSFTEFYVPVIVEVTQLLQQLPDRYDVTKNIPYGLMQAACARTLTALKLRRTRFLPIGHDAETGYAQADHWTYAIFICALMRDLWKCTEFYLMVKSKTIEYPIPFEPLTQPTEGAYIRTEPKPYSLNNKSNLGLLVARLNPEAIEFLQRHSLVWQHVVLYWHGQPNMISEFIPTQSDELSEEIITAVYKEPFISQLNKLLGEQRIICNEPDSVLQCTNEGLLIIMPDFLKHWENLTDQSFTQPQLLNQLKNESLIIKNNQSDLHTYYQGQGFNKTVYEGYLVDKTKIIPTITINDTLYREQ